MKQSSDGDLDSLQQQSGKEAVTVDISVVNKKFRSEQNIDVYWVSGELEPVAPKDVAGGVSTKWKVKLVYQGSINSKTSISKSTFVGHTFVATARRDDDDESLCTLEVWRAVRSDDVERQRLFLDEISTRTVVPGLKPCLSGFNGERPSATKDDLEGQNDEF